MLCIPTIKLGPLFILILNAIKTMKKKYCGIAFYTLPITKNVCQLNATKYVPT